MPNLATLFDTALDAAFAAVAGIPGETATTKALDDPQLLRAQKRLSELSRLVDSRAAALAGEVAFRSRRELGYAGLAQKEGFQTAEKLIQHATGSTRREATTLVAVGTLVHEATIETAVDPVTGELPEEFTVRVPWLARVGAAVAAGDLSVAAATAIRNGLGEPAAPGTEGGVTLEQLTDAVRVLVLEATGTRGSDDGASHVEGLNADLLYQRARQLRDELDEAGITARERLAYEQRAFRRVRRANGCSRFILDGDVETSAWLDDLYDKLTSPRRGGPRFIDPADQAWAANIATDPRSTEQYLHDAMMGLLHKGVDSDQAATDAEGVPEGARARRRTTRIVGSRIPAVRVLVTETALRTRTGHGRVEGTDTPVSIETVERIICTSGTIPIVFGPDGNVLNLGREQRLFSTSQKTAMGARDGGCIWTNCDRPATWTEAHHINQWARDGGRTDLADGVLLCRHHHLLLHNNHWEIVRKGNTYWLIPPSDIDPAQTPRPLHTKSAALRALQREREKQHADARAG